MHAHRPMLVSEPDFLALPESVDKVELLDGEVHVAPSPTVRHNLVLGNLVFALRTWARAQARPVTVGQAPQDIRFGPERILQPDAFVILDRIDWDRPGPIDRVPELCVEVLSIDRMYDRVTKRLVYAVAGVREYWVVEPTGLIERWTGEGLVQADEITETLVTSLLPGLSLDVPSLFRD